MFSRRDRAPLQVTPPQETPGIMAAKAAKVRARQGLLDAVESGEESRAVVGRMATLLQDNHFGPTVYKAITSP